MENIKDFLRHELIGSIYNKARTSTALLTVDGIAATIMTIQNPSLASACGALTVASAIGYLVEEKLRKNNIKEIVKLYQEFIKNYNEMNRTFGLQNPAELQAMFVWLLEKGYLSAEKTYQDSVKETRETLTINGVNILMGQGICRHKIPMFRDISNDYGIETFAFSGYLEDYDKSISMKFFIDMFALETVEEMIKMQEIDGKSLQKECAFLSEQRAKLEKDKLDAILSSKKTTQGLIGNHVMSLSLYNGESYYLGPNWHEIYEFDSNSKALYSDSAIVQINLEGSTHYNDKKNLQRLKEILESPTPCASREEILRLMKATEKIGEQNKDIFEQFY